MRSGGRGRGSYGKARQARQAQQAAAAVGAAAKLVETAATGAGATPDTGAQKKRPSKAGVRRGEIGTRGRARKPLETETGTPRGHVKDWAESDGDDATDMSEAEVVEEEQVAEDKRAKWVKGDGAVKLLHRAANPRKPKVQPANRFGLLQSEDEDAKPMEDVGLGREVPEKQKRPLSGEASPAHSRPGWGEDSSGPDEVSEEVDPRDAVGAGQLLLTYAGLPESAPPAPTRSPTTEPLLLPTPPPTQAPLPTEVATRETPTQLNAMRTACSGF